MKKLCPDCLSSDLVNLDPETVQCDGCNEIHNIWDLIDDPGDDGIDEEDTDIDDLEMICPECSSFDAVHFETEFDSPGSPIIYKCPDCGFASYAGRFQDNK